MLRMRTACVSLCATIMLVAGTIAASADDATVSAELELLSILEGPAFSGSARSRAFLQFVVEGKEPHPPGDQDQSQRDGVEGQPSRLRMKPSGGGFGGVVRTDQDQCGDPHRVGQVDQHRPKRYQE